MQIDLDEGLYINDGVRSPLLVFEFDFALGLALSLNSVLIARLNLASASPRGAQSITRLINLCSASHHLGWVPLSKLSLMDA